MFKRILQVVFFIGAFCVLFNYRVRAACLVLGVLMFVAILSSRPYFENNRTYVGCLWFLAGLQVSGMKPWPLRFQVILLYFGAGLNKLLDPDWRSGQFFENMITAFGHLQSYMHFSWLLPHLWLSCALGWTVIIVEFVLSAGFLIRPLWGPIAWIGMAYHTALLLVAGKTFGMFYFATLSSFLVFVNWPPLPLKLSFVGDASGEGRIPGWLRKFDFDGLFVFAAEREDDPDWRRTGNNPRVGLRLSVGSEQYAGISALYMALIYSPLTYFSFAVILSLPFAVLSVFRLGLSVFFLFFMAPALLGPAVRAFRRERPLAKILLARSPN